MSDTAIAIEGLGKKYVLRHERQKQRYTALRDVLASKAASMLKRRAESLPPKEEFWALRDVSFEIKKGEAVGIIGRNGAGKSTLLKLLSRITQPTTGEIGFNGRLASLLEVGTGFHPELTGRENIFLNGSILGMKRTEIIRKFDEIVAFAEIERFLDTPVKRYSSGMYVRLAFAVAAHLDPEILVVDEVLAVGDAAFQKKCLEKMQDEGRSGRTVLFVSHNMQAVTRLCSRAMLLRDGRLIVDGGPAEVVHSYLEHPAYSAARREWPDLVTAPGDDITRLRAVHVRSNLGDVSSTLDIRSPAIVEISFDVLKGGHILTPNFHFFDSDGTCIFATIDSDPAWRRRIRPIGNYKSTAVVPGNFFSEGTVSIGVAVSTISSMVVHFFERDAISFEVVDTTEGDSARGDYAGGMGGVVRPLLEWKTIFTANPSERCSKR